MDAKTLYEHMEKWLQENVLAMAKIKGTEYAKAMDKDQLANFKKAAALRNTTPEDILFGYVTKHIVALDDFIKEMSDVANHAPRPIEQWDEKIFDIILYMLLMRGLLEERKL